MSRKKLYIVALSGPVTSLATDVKSFWASGFRMFDSVSRVILKPQEVWILSAVAAAFFSYLSRVLQSMSEIDKMPVMSDAVKMFTHPDLNKPVTAIGGHYVITGEQIVGFQGEKLLVFLGHAVFDTTCCGAGGCAYALVPGFIDSYRCLKDASGKWLSSVRPIRDDRLRREVAAVIIKKTNALQVQFL